MDEDIENKETEISQYKLSDYEYKSWSYGVPVPDGWERCPGDKVDVVRRLKAKPVGSKGISVTVETLVKTCQHKVKNNDEWESWNKPCGGCC